MGNKKLFFSLMGELVWAVTPPTSRSRQHDTTRRHDTTRHDGHDDTTRRDDICLAITLGTASNAMG